MTRYVSIASHPTFDFIICHPTFRSHYTEQHPTKDPQHFELRHPPFDLIICSPTFRSHHMTPYILMSSYDTLHMTPSVWPPTYGTLHSDAIIWHPKYDTLHTTPYILIYDTPHSISSPYISSSAYHMLHMTPYISISLYDTLHFGLIVWHPTFCARIPWSCSRCSRTQKMSSWWGPYSNILYITHNPTPYIVVCLMKLLHMLTNPDIEFVKGCILWHPAHHTYSDTLHSGALYADAEHEHAHKPWRRVREGIHILTP